MGRFMYPCTGRVETAGFAAFLERELGASRHNLQSFAAELGRMFAAPHVTLVNSGSSANLAAALALAEETGPGEAIVGGFTFPTTMSALITAGLQPRVVDCEPGGFCLDPQALARAINPRTRVVCVTHFLGFPARLEQIRRIADAHGLRVLQDACETMDLRISGRPAHSFGDLTTWSFYHPHHLSAFGGGAVIAHDPALRRRVESLTHWGRACTCHYDPTICEAPPGKDHNFWYLRTGHNLELSELNACFGRYQLQTWTAQEARRRHHHEILRERLTGLEGVTIYPAPADQGTPFVFPISLATAFGGDLEARIAARGVEVRTLMGGVITDQPAYHDVLRDDLERCRDLAARSFMVGIHQTLATPDVATVAAILREEILKKT